MTMAALPCQCHARTFPSEVRPKEIRREVESEELQRLVVTYYNIHPVESTSRRFHVQ